MHALINWYLTTSLIGLLSFPLAYRLLPGLCDRGYATVRALGLLLWGYLFWLLASLGILRNDSAGLFFATLVLISLSAWALRGTDLDELRDWVRSQSRLILWVEALFLITFAGWAVVRAANPEALGTEKPMELAFINAILNSPTFPPHDPWLSGYAISYYYFGYVLVSMIAKVTQTPGGVAFNLGVSLLFALCATGAFGLVYNLLQAPKHFRSESAAHPTRSKLLSSLLGPLFILVVSNLEGFLHMLHTRGFFWKVSASGELTSPFWKWLDIQDLNVSPELPFHWVPTRFWWWWRASRVLQDYDLSSNVKEIIDEFPFFSYLLADLHPHVLAMPFALLAMALALNVFLSQNSTRIDWLRRDVNLRTVAWLGVVLFPLGMFLLGTGLAGLRLSFVILGIAACALSILFFIRLRPTLSKHNLDTFLRGDLGCLRFGIVLHIHWTDFLLGAVVLGGLAFLNTWDSPFYVALFAAAYAWKRAFIEQKRLTYALNDFFWMALTLGTCGILLYLPFYLGFSSQVGGVLPNLIYPTRGAHLWVMFAPLLIPIFALLILHATQNQKMMHLKKGIQGALGIVVGLWLFSLLLGAAIIVIPEIGQLYLSSLAAPSVREVFSAAFARRLENSGGWLTLTGLLILTLAAFVRFDEGFAQEKKAQEAARETDKNPSVMAPALAFNLLLVLLGLLLVLLPEFVFLRDQFGWRMNTIFKFYFQAWLLWGIAAAHASVTLPELIKNRFAAITFRLGLALVIGMSLVYPAFSLISKTEGFQPPDWNLDSSAYFEKQAPEEAKAIRWLQTAPKGIIAEAVPPGGGSYTQYARVSTLSGLPTVLGWVGHESQWRGGGQEMGTRQSDLERLYCTRDWQEARTILDYYQIRYIFVGFLERSAYQPNASTCPIGLYETKFIRYLKPVFQGEQVTIYEYLPTSPP